MPTTQQIRNRMLALALILALAIAACGSAAQQPAGGAETATPAGPAQPGEPTATALGHMEPIKQGTPEEGGECCDPRPTPDLTPTTDRMREALARWSALGIHDYRMVMAVVERPDNSRQEQEVVVRNGQPYATECLTTQCYSFPYVDPKIDGVEKLFFYAEHNALDHSVELWSDGACLEVELHPEYSFPRKIDTANCPRAGDLQDRSSFLEVVTFEPIDPVANPVPTKEPLAEGWETRWLRGIPCQLPCLEGVTPGITNPREAAEILRKSPIVRDVELDNGYVIWHWLNGEQGGEMHYDERDKDALIGHISLHLPRETTLTEIMQYLGEPSHVRAYAFMGYHGDGPFYGVEIYYKQLGLTLDPYSDIHGKPVISPDMTFFAVDLAPAGELSQIPIMVGDESLQQQTPWEGFKDFDYYCRDDQGGELCLGKEEAHRRGGGQVRWFVGLGTGTSTEQQEKEQAIVNHYNGTNSDHVGIQLYVIPSSEAYQVLDTQIAAGTPPDIIGPVGLHGIDTYRQHLLPLDDLIEKYNVDLSAYDKGALDAYRNEQGQLIALPYALYPSFIYFNKDLFDELDLPYPPQHVGDLYEGKAWDMDALRALAMRLTVDENGVAADEEGFDPTKIVQFGFVPQWSDRAIDEGAFFGAGDLTGPNGEATIPDTWKEAWKWFYNARHVDHFMPDATYRDSDEFGKSNVWIGTGDGVGRVAMAWTHLWFTCCFKREEVRHWDIAVVPSYNGATTSKLHADTFAIMKATENPDAAFKAYLFLLRSPELRALYGGLPGLKQEQAAYFETLSEKYAPNVVNWDVVLEMLGYPDIPNHEQWVPNALKFQERYAAFDTLRHADPTLDIDAEIEQLERDLTAIFGEK